jgi:tRNA (guanine-N7-)-methyltransferase
MPAEGRFRDKLPEDYRFPDLNPFLKLHREFGPPVLTASQVAQGKGRWAEVFERQAPLHLEIGSGNGFFLAGMAKHLPEWNWLGLELRFKRVVLTARKLQAAGVQAHSRIGRYEAHWLDDLFGEASLSGVYVNFPDPWPKERHAKHRVLGPEFMASVATMLVPGGELRIKTDHQVNVRAALTHFQGLPLEVIGLCQDVQTQGPPWDFDVVTNYQSKFYRRGIPVHAIRLVRMA